MGKEKDKMKFKMPEARRERMEELLEYLGDTSNYSKYYDGNRAEDFKKCFDIESEWCWKYADLMLRGIKKRNLEYAEGHHVVPASFYGKRRCRTVDDGNITVLSYADHLLAHYCLVWCSTGKMRGKMARAFLTMYNVGMSGRLSLMPSEKELINAISEIELRRIRAMEPQWAKVEAEGRTHLYEDPKQHHKDYRKANKGKISKRSKAYYEANKEKLSHKNKAWREANKGKISKRSKAYYEANREMITKKNKAWRVSNKGKISKRSKAYYEANREMITKKNKAWRVSNKEKFAEYRKSHYEANKEMITEHKKAYYEANKEKFAERRKAYYEANKEKILEQRKIYVEANKEMITEHKKAYYEANREQILEQKKAYGAANREKIAKKNKAYREANRGKIAEQKKARYEAMKADGYRFRKNILTGKQEWVFVGLPEQEVAA